MPDDAFVLRVLVKAPLETVWEAWISPVALDNWLVRADLDGPFLPGTGYQWTWSNGYVETGNITEANEPVRLAFTFATDSGVEVTLAPFEGRTAVELRQTQSHPDPAERANVGAECKQGWTFYLTNLKAWLEHGVDLREHEAAELPNLVNV